MFNTRHETPTRIQAEPPAASGEVAQGGLSKVDVVIVKDTWNKFLPHDGLLIEMLFERLLLELPELIDQFGPALDRAQSMLLGLIDTAVRALDPRTEVLLRETYKSPPSMVGSPLLETHVYGQFFSTYGMTADAWRVAGHTFVWVMSKIPYLEDFERESLAHKDASALGRFFAEHVAAPMIAHSEAEDVALVPEVVEEMQHGAQKMLANSGEAGSFFYQRLFNRHPDLIRHFRTADMDNLARHLIDTVVFLSRAAGSLRGLRGELRNLAQVHQSNEIPAGDYRKLAEPLLETLDRYGVPLSASAKRGWSVLFERVICIVSEPMLVQERLLSAARKFIDQMADELDWPETRLEKRWSAIVHEARATGSYTQTFEELEYGARLAWRNAPKCIGRISWKNLIVRDRRHVNDPEAIFAECVEHLRAATNDGNIEIVLTMFRPTRPQERWGPRLWNSQLIRYAAYPMADGSVLGDRANLDLTEAIRKLGWRQPAKPTNFDPLPLVVDVPGHDPRMFNLDPDDILEVAIEHPTNSAIGALGLKWCAVPAIANFRLEIGGLDYGCLPFNGWFMGTEIARNLFEDKRYARAEAIAEAFGLDTSSEATLWRDRAFLELNVAIVHSFQKARVTLVDHQTAARQFMIHDLREKKAGRECPAQWSWIAPAAGGSTSPVWHHEMRDFHLSPSYAYAADRWAVMDRDLEPAKVKPVVAKGESKRPLVLYVSETGTAEGYARQAARRLASLSPQVMALDEMNPVDLARESQILLIVATCRDGDTPASGRAALEWLRNCPADAMADVEFAVLGIGNRIYSKFCAAALAFDAALQAAGAYRIAAVELADEIAGQSDIVRRWFEMFAKLWAAENRTQKPRRADVELIPPVRTSAPDPKQLCAIAFNDEMLDCGVGSDRSTRHIGFALPPEAGSYEPGDHLAVFPVNPDALVKGICDHLGMPRDSWFRILGSSQPMLDRYRDGYPLDRLLSEDLELRFPEAPEELLASMLAVSRDADDKAQLEGWLETLNYDNTDPAREALCNWLRDTYHTLLCIFDAFPQSVPPIDVLIEILPRQKPRMYSIASSPRIHPREPRIMAGALTLPSRDGRKRRGLCSHFLRALEPGDKVRVAVKPSPRRIASDFAGPLVMVGAGTGLAPLYGILEDRDARGVLATEAGPVALYLGCRGPQEFLMRNDLMRWRKNGCLTRISVAYSRSGPVKAYVQDALDLDGSLVWSILSRKDASFMICGDAKMAHDVEERLLVILQREGGLGYTDAKSMIETMKDEGRFIEDVWGVTLNREVAMPEIVQFRYNQGAGWLRRIQRALVGKRSDTDAIERV